MYRPRLMESRLKALLANFPAVVVSGARQVGKTTLVRHALPGMSYEVLDPTLDPQGARTDPELFLDNHPAPLIVDEVQYAPELVGCLKRRIDFNRRPGQYVLTGSHHWSILKTLSESLAGRAVFIDLEGFSLQELAGATVQSTWLSTWLASPTLETARCLQVLNLPRPLNDQLWRGFLPGAQDLDATVLPDLHAAYRRAYIERDVRLVADIGDFHTFGRFFQLLCALTAQEINHSQVGRELGVTPQTAARWLDVLKATFQWFEIQPYHGNAVKRLSRRPKGYLADTGTVCNAQSISSANVVGVHPLRGALFETAVVAEVRKLCAVMAQPPALYHWRSHAGAEVDLLLERDGRVYPLEIKATSAPKSASVRGLRAFRETYPRLPIAPALVLCPTARSYALDQDTRVLPWNAVAAPG